MGFERLVGLAPPPEGRTHRHDWARFERDLGHPLPADYKRVADAYGSRGAFGGFITVHEPNSSNEFVDLTRENEGKISALRVLAEDEELPYRVDEPSELMAWGGNDNGDFLMWHRNSPDPDQWTIVVIEARDPESWFTFEGGLADFLCAVLTRETRVPVFPEDFPPTDPTFLLPRGEFADQERRVTGHG